MRDIANQLAAHGLNLFELRCHLIEACGELSDLIRTTHLNPFRIMSISDVL